MRPPPTGHSATVIMALHHRSVEPQPRQACYGRGHPVNDSVVTEGHRNPVFTSATPLWTKKGALAESWEISPDGLTPPRRPVGARERELLELIKKYVTDKADAAGVVAEQVVFQRSQIRAYTSWSFAQVRNNFRTLADYEYIQLIKARSGLANQYRLSAHYSDLDFLTTILSPEDLTARIKAQPAAAGAAT